MSLEFCCFRSSAKIRLTTLGIFPFLSTPPFVVATSVTAATRTLDPDNRWGLHFPNLRLYFTAFLMTMFLSTVYIKPLEKEYVFKQIFLLTKLQSDVRNAVSSCGVSIFVFDEVHKMPPGVLNALVPFLGFSQSIDGVDYRRSIFIFLG
ncbi:unnamed protein product [Dibothriocephalus latus]|uniref:Uncharacterized protein n=1 Tax=Dibothriocephalus latus TaxID=60516 RepID=A0A3P7PC43_DIBLA|nr:unnamed protein product [Dibothriocephalus latus]